MTDAPSLPDLQHELAELRRHREVREREGRLLGWGAASLGPDLDFLADVRREELAAEHARIAELEAAIARLEADQPNSPERVDDVWRQLEARQAGRRQDCAP